MHIHRPDPQAHDSARPTRHETLAGAARVSGLALTDGQHEDYRALLAQARALRAAGRHDEAQRIACIAANILRTGAPGLE